jgi:hypothetical protein
MVTTNDWGIEEHSLVNTVTLATIASRAGRRRSAGWGLLCGTFICASAMACSSGEVVPIEEQTKSSDLHSASWGSWEGSLFDPGFFAADLGACSNIRGYTMIAGLNFTDEHYYLTYEFGEDNDPGWEQVGNVQFFSAPTCVFEYPYRTRTFPTDYHFVMAGKGFDGKIYAFRGRQDEGMGGPPPLPAFETTWAAVSATTYKDSFGNPDNYGRPAISTNGSVTALTFMTSDRKVHAFTRGIPFNGSGVNWSTEKVGPALPSGLTADGIPAITYVRGFGSSAINKFIVMVRAVPTSGAARLYWIYFDGASFGTWTQATIPSPYKVDSDPAVEYDDQLDALTVYFKSTDTNNGTIVQASVPNATNIGSSLYPFFPIAVGQTGSPDTVNAPRAIFGAGSDLGIRSVVTRGKFPGTLSGNEFKTLMVAEDLHMSPLPIRNTNPPEFSGNTMPNDAEGICADYQPPTDLFINGNNFAAGCPGSVSYANRATLCAPGSRPCTAAEYTAALGTGVPTHDYWVEDNLNHRSGNTSGACFASTTTGTACPAGTAMKVCRPSGNDAEGNSCVVNNCGLNSNSPNKYFGGCNGATGGTLCCLGVP